MKNLKNVICHIGTFLASILMIVFLTQAHVSSKYGISIGGFDLNGRGATDTLITAYAFVIIAMIVASLLVILSVLNLLADFNVIKENKFMSIANIVLSAIAFVAAIIIFACVASEVADISSISVGFGAIIDLILGFVLIPLALLPVFTFKKRK